MAEEHRRPAYFQPRARCSQRRGSARSAQALAGTASATRHKSVMTRADTDAILRIPQLEPMQRRMAIGRQFEPLGRAVCARRSSRLGVTMARGAADIAPNTIGSRVPSELRLKSRALSRIKGDGSEPSSPTRSAISRRPALAVQGDCRDASCGGEAFLGVHWRTYMHSRGRGRAGTARGGEERKGAAECVPGGNRGTFPRPDGR